MIQQPALVNLVISSGEPAGVGPEVSIAAALAFLQEQPASTITLLGDPSVFPALDIPRELSARLKVESSPLSCPVVAGQLNPVNAQSVLNILDAAVKGCLDGRFDAMVTAPIQKSVINEGNISGKALFTGHTEYLAKLCHQEHVVMMLCAALPAGFLGLQKSRDLRVALVTTHLPLRDVPSALNQQHILETIQIVDQDLRGLVDRDRRQVHRLVGGGQQQHAGLRPALQVFGQQHAFKFAVRDDGHLQLQVGVGRSIGAFFDDGLGVNRLLQVSR